MTPPADVRAAAVEAAAGSAFDRFMSISGTLTPRWVNVLANRATEPVAQDFYEHWTRIAEQDLTAAILELEKHGFKVTGPKPTDDMRAKADDLPDWDDADSVWTVQHKAALGWGDGT